MNLEFSPEQPKKEVPESKSPHTHWAKKLRNTALMGVAALSINLATPPEAVAQNFEGNAEYVVSTIKDLGALVHDDTVSVNFEVPLYGGMVEFTLYDDTGNKIWFYQKNFEKTTEEYDHAKYNQAYLDPSETFIQRSIDMKLKNFKPGTIYTYTLSYKGSEVAGTMTIPGLIQ